MNVAPMQTSDPLKAVAMIPERSLEVMTTTVRIHELTIERPAIAAYLEQLAPNKREIALIHALEVGIMELAARRARFKK